MKSLRYLLILLIVGYIGINFIAPLPPFLIGENITYAILYAFFLVYMERKGYENKTFALLATLLGFNVGRVSRSIVSPRGEIEYLALEHIPLISYLLLVLVVVIYQLMRQEK
ncbi:MAG: hypothetical protein ACP6IP_07035 [Candidatus Njordarchaeia archaeon]